MRHQRRVRINAPPTRVWELIDDSSKLPLWMPNIVSTRYPNGPPGDNPVGTRFLQEMRQGEGEVAKITTYEGEVTAYEKGRLLGVLMLPEALAVHAVYNIEGDEDWTLLNYGCDVRSKTLRGHLMLFFYKKYMSRILDQQLARLKWVAEGRE